MKITAAPRGLMRALLAILAVTTIATTSWAWTDKPVKLIVPAPAGGTMDVVARILADQIAADIGQTVIVENKPGAGGAIGVQAMLATPADGQTIMVTASNILTEIPHVMKTSFDPLKDVRPIATVARASMVLTGAPGLAAKDFAELGAYLKANPGKLSFASYSTGTASHYAGMILNQKLGVDLTHVPFPGSPPALMQLMGGNVTLMFDGIVTTLPFQKSGKLKVYAVASKARSAQLPQVPTLTELGYPEFDFSNWLGVIASAKTPDALADKINAAILKAASNPKVQERFNQAGFEPNTPLSPAQLTQSVRTEFERNAVIVKTFNIKLDQ